MPLNQEGARALGGFGYLGSSARVCYGDVLIKRNFGIKSYGCD